VPAHPHWSSARRQARASLTPCAHRADALQRIELGGADRRSSASAAARAPTHGRGCACGVFCCTPLAPAAAAAGPPARQRARNAGISAEREGMARCGRRVVRACACVRGCPRAGWARHTRSRHGAARDASLASGASSGPADTGRGAAKQQERASSLGGGPEGRHAPPDEMMGNERADKIAWRDLCQQLCQRLSPAPAQPAPGQFE